MGVWSEDYTGHRVEAEQIVSKRTDADKLRLLADWFDERDFRLGIAGATEVQADLRRIAAKLE